MSIDWRLEHYPRLPSTQTALVERAVAGEPAGLVIVATEQTAGRGRGGRHWYSPPGNLYLSVLLRPGGAGREAPQWSLLAGLALAEAAAPLAKGRVSLKWPNDLLREGAKCAGILAETALAADGDIAWVALGIGVNLQHAPVIPNRPTTTLGEPAAPVDFAHRLLSRLDIWQRRAPVAGFGRVRATWMEFGPAPGEMISLRDGPSGARYLGLASDGALLVELGNERRAIHAGQILGAGEI